MKNSLVEKIHQEFDGAEDRLLAEAKGIINSGSVDSNAERLEKIGFVGSLVVRKHKARKDIIVKSKQQAEAIEYYKATYPFQKFITEDELDRICKKYGLAYAPISAYKKAVPEKNISEIEAAAILKSDDSPTDILKCKVKLESFIWLDDTFLNRASPLYYKLPRIIDGHFDSSFEVDSLFKKQYDTGTFEYLVRSIRNITISRQGLFIAAPPSHFHRRGLVKDGKYGYFSFSITEPEDPIVFRYVKGGVQIISKWGDEASDELVVNEKQN